MSKHEMEIRGIFEREAGSLKAVILKQKSRNRYVTIWIGPTETEALVMHLRNIKATRPLTHDLLHNAINGIGGKVKRIIVTAVKDNTVYSVVEVNRDGETVEIDSRPSDALVLAMRANAPIFATEQLLEDMGQRLEEHEEAAEDSPQPAEEAGKSSPRRRAKQSFSFTLGNEERRRLSPLSKFIDTLDFDAQESGADK